MAETTSWTSCGAMCAARSVRSRRRGRSCSFPICRRPGRARSCAVCSRTSPRTARSAMSRRWRTPRSWISSRRASPRADRPGSLHSPPHPCGDPRHTDVLLSNFRVGRRRVRRLHPRAAGRTAPARMERMRRGTTIDGARVPSTGAGSGIGRLMALGAAARGAAEILIGDLSADSGDAVRDEITATGGQARAFEVNVADSAQVETVAERTGPVDILINCAGIVTGKKLLDADADAIRRVFDVNTLALYWTTKAFLPGMLAR